MSILATLGSLPTRYKSTAALAIALAALLVVGVPLSTLVPFAGMAACLGMHFFMGHGEHHSPSVARSPETDHGSVPIETPALDR